MKKIISSIAVLVFILFSLQGNSQSMFDIFLNLPDSALFGTSTDLKQVMLDGYKNNNIDYTQKLDLYYVIDTIDHKNGYMSVSGGMECHWEMCYWNISKEKKLVAVNILCCGPQCYTELLAFYHYDGQTLTPLSTSDIIPDVWPDFFKGDVIETENKFAGDEGTMSALLFNLPQEGTSIKAFFTLWETEIIQHEYFNGNAMMLQWNSGTFKKDKLFWDNDI